ncbi:MAG: sigma-70 family RNA polymerase sigma factor [Propionicimonas sp.]|nr:sigma-70 family RNA polymerase sigma factor [Propionicimonas sp.]
MFRFDAATLLTPEREVCLARTIEAGVIARHALAQPWRTDATEAELRRLVAEGDRARDDFLLANLRLVAQLARAAARRTGVEFDELFQEGFLALGRALQRFDHTRGRFTTYAVPVIGQHLVRVTSSLAGHLGVSAGRAVAHRRVVGLADQLAQDLGRTVGPDDVSAMLGRDRDWTARLIGLRPPVPLDELSHAPAAPERAEWQDRLFAAALGRVVRRLPPDQRTALELRFGFADGRCHSYREVARRLGVSPASARRIEQRGLASLRRRRGELGLVSEAG